MSNKIVSIILCCRNEEAYISRCLDSLINQKNIEGDYEILVLDGMSTDKGREIIFAKMKETDKIRFFDNTRILKVYGVNIGFKNAKGDNLVICDGHTVYDEYFLSRLLLLSKEHPEADCVGGPVIHMGENNFAKATAAAMSSKICVGNPTHRFPEYEGYGEMSLWPLFRKKVLTDVGYYDEELIIAHDDDYCYRIRKNGGKVYLSSKVKTYYFVRKNPFKLFYQYYTYGKYRIPSIQKHKRPISYRQLIPALFYTIMILLFLADLILPGFPFSVILPAIYASTLIAFGLKTMVRNGIKVGMLFPVAVFTIHLAHATGFFWGLIYFNYVHKINFSIEHVT